MEEAKNGGQLLVLDEAANKSKTALNIIETALQYVQYHKFSKAATRIAFADHIYLYM